MLNDMGVTNKSNEGDNNYFNNSFIIVDEVHNFISRIANGSKIAMKIYNNIVIAKDVKLVLLSGTPIINQPYEISFLINLLRGQMLTYKIPILQGIADKKALKDILIKSQHYDYIDEIYNDNKYVNIILFPKNYVRKDNDSSVIVRKDWIKEDKDIIKDIINTINKDKFSGILKNRKSVINTFESKKPYLIVTNGTTGSLKTKMADYIIDNYKLSTDNIKINIDDLVIKNKEYKKRILDIIKKVNKECNNNRACILEKYENPSDKLLEEFHKAYYDIRTGVDNIECSPRIKKSCDMLNDLNLENALRESRNIVFETQGLSVPNWLLSQPYLTEKSTSLKLP